MQPRSRKFIAYGAALAALAAVFALYTRPDLMVALSEQIWSCFGK
jgi:hypothetical protein